MKIKVYQINPERDINRVAFLGTHGLKSLNKQQESDKVIVDSSIYDEVFYGEIDAADLEVVFVTFGQNRPEGFKGRSMSVSDVVEIIYSDGENPGFYFCDSIGFTQIDFDPELTGKAGENKCTH